MTYTGRHRAGRLRDKDVVMSKLVTSVAAAALLGCTLLTGPPATAVAPVPHRSTSAVGKAKPCLSQWFCVPPIDLGQPRPYGP